MQHHVRQEVFNKNMPEDVVSKWKPAQVGFPWNCNVLSALKPRSCWSSMIFPKDNVHQHELHRR